MSFKKLPEQLKENLAKEEITKVRPEQKLAWQSIREGKNLSLVGDEASGKTFLLLISTLMRVPEPQEGSPRAVIICKDDEASNNFHDTIKRYGKYMDLTFDLILSKGNSVKQRNDLFDGTEIVIGTTKRLHDLYIQNGLNLNLVRFLAIDDAQDVFKGTNPGFLIRLFEGLPKCQVVIAGEQKTDKQKEFLSKIDLPFSTVKLQ